MSAESEAILLRLLAQDHMPAGVFVGRHPFRSISGMARRSRSAGCVARALFRGGNGPLALLLAMSAVAAGCGNYNPFSDPIQDAERDALGPENPNVPKGPLHRPGQPCAVCHRDGGEDPAFVFAGTVYRDPVETIAVADADVLLTDAAGRTFMTKTNCVGNFYVKENEFQQTWPVWTSVQRIEFPWTMESPIHREASCAKCHYDPAGTASAGHLFVTDDQTTFASITSRPCDASDSVTR